MNDLRLADSIEHIRQACADTGAFIDGMNKASFLSDKRTQKAVVMSLMIIGEAAARIMDRHPDFTARHPETRWRDMRGMRNRIAHGYFDIDLDIVWETAESALPILQAQMQALLDQISNGEHRQ